MNKKVFITADSSLLLCLAVAVAVYFGLRTLAPRKAQTADNTTVQKTKEQIEKEADAHYQAADAALKVGDAEKGIAELKAAQSLYEQLGDVTKLEEIKDQISLAEYAIKASGESKSTEMPKDQGKASKTP